MRACNLGEIFPHPPQAAEVGICQGKLEPLPGRRGQPALHAGGQNTQAAAGLVVDYLVLPAAARALGVFQIIKPSPSGQQIIADGTPVVGFKRLALFL
jgi:hypothetical protein